MGPTTGPMQTNQDALPPDYAVVRGCATDYCNTDLKTHDALPNLSQGELGAVAGEIRAGLEKMELKRLGAGLERSRGRTGGVWSAAGELRAGELRAGDIRGGSGGGWG